MCDLLLLSILNFRILSQKIFVLGVETHKKVNTIIIILHDCRLLIL